MTGRSCTELEPVIHVRGASSSGQPWLVSAKPIIPFPSSQAEVASQI